MNTITERVIKSIVVAIYKGEWYSVFIVPALVLACLVYVVCNIMVCSEARTVESYITTVFEP